MGPRERTKHPSVAVLVGQSFMGWGEEMETMWDARSGYSRPSQESVQAGCVVCSS